MTCFTKCTHKLNLFLIFDETNILQVVKERRWIICMAHSMLILTVPRMHWYRICIKLPAMLSSKRYILTAFATKCRVSFKGIHMNVGWFLPQSLKTFWNCNNTWNKDNIELKCLEGSNTTKVYCTTSNSWCHTQRQK